MPCSAKKRTAKSFSSGLEPPESTHMLPWPVGADPVMWGAESEVVITLGAITSWALAADAPRRTSSASLRIILTPSSAGLVPGPQVANSLILSSLLGCYPHRIPYPVCEQLPAGTLTPSDRSRM